MTEIVGLNVSSYKNLRDVWLPWSDGIALFGVNGSGKTNLLECLTLLLGTPQTIRLARSRLREPGPDALSLLIRPGSAELPWPQDAVLRWADRAAEAGSGLPFIARAAADSAWWTMLGSRSGDDFQSGVAAAALPPVAADFVARIAANPVIRYSLTSIKYPSAGSVGTAVRRFARTLMAASVPNDVAGVADDLPVAFSPLRTHLVSAENHRAGWVPILELPPVDECPATLQWLPRARTADEVNDDLLAAFTAASGPAAMLEGIFGEQLPLVNPPKEGDWHWWLHEIGQTRGTEELNLTLPGVTIDAAGGGDADFALVVRAAGARVELSHTGDADVLEYFSSGERRWVDEALATVARELTRFGHRAALHADRFFDLDDDVVMAAVMEVADGVDRSVRENEFWTGETFDRLLYALEPALIAAAHKYVDGAKDVVIAAFQLQMSPGLSLLQTPLVVRVFDEPEAHLHPSAQRRTAIAIDALRLRGENVVVASHSPHFLDLPGWSLVHVQPGEGSGARVELLPPESVSARSALAAQLGVNRGELLAGINGLLIVEGLHDQQVLQRLFGPQLQEAGMAVVRMFGTDNLMATAELDFLDQYLDVPITVLLDYTRVDRVRAGRPVTDEEKKLLEFRRTCSRRKRSYQLVGLDRPDVVCYLSEAAIEEVYPGFPGWRDVIARFERRTSRPRFKPWLAEQYNVDLTNSGRIASILDRMEASSLRPVGELTRKVNDILSHALPTKDDGGA